VNHIRPVLLLCACLLFLPVLRAATTPQQILSRLQSSSITIWHRVAAIDVEGKEQTDGLDCSMHIVIDVRNGRWRKDEHCPLFSAAEGIDTQGAWKLDYSGQVHSLDSPEANRLTVTDRWLYSNGPLFYRRLPAALQALAPAADHSVTYERVDATPSGGRTVTLWIDTAHHALARTVMLRSFNTVTTRYDDYQDVNGLQLPFRITSDVGDPSDADIETVTHYRLLDSVPVQALARPGNAVTDVQLGGGRTRLPLSIAADGKLLVDARINGKGPFPFVLDTGGHAILSPTTAQILGLKTGGAGESHGAGAGTTQISYTRVSSIELGKASITNQSFMVMPMSPLMIDQGDKPPIAGILGLEIFERFAVTIDFDHAQLILQSFDTANPPVGATALPIYFTDDMPLVYASLDDKRGIFGIDTGNSGPLMLFPQWADANGLARYYSAGLPIPNGGVGGMFMTHAAYIHSLHLASLTVPGEQPGLLTPKGVGATSNPSEAGNLGMSVWRNFRVTLNYRTSRLYLTPRAHYTPPYATSSGGFSAVKPAPDFFMVVQVVPDSAAAKNGLKKGDRIVAVDNVAAKNLASLYLVEYMAHAKPGTHVKLALSDGRHFDITLTTDTMREKAMHPQLK
jgi:Aspartyl protease/PDZ domain